MKSNPLGALLVAVLILCAVITTWLSVRYFYSVRELQKLQAQYLAINNTLAAVQSLAAASVEYSKRNPAIDGLLQQFDLKPKPAAATPGTTPTTKPAGR